jgi:hypothetical protein
LNGNTTKELRYVFSRQLPSGFYYTRVEFDSVCYVDTSRSH